MIIPFGSFKTKLCLWMFHDFPLDELNMKLTINLKRRWTLCQVGAFRLRSTCHSNAVVGGPCRWSETTKTCWGRTGGYKNWRSKHPKHTSKLIMTNWLSTKTTSWCKSQCHPPSEIRPYQLVTNHHCPLISIIVSELTLRWKMHHPAGGRVNLKGGSLCCHAVMRSHFLKFFFPQKKLDHETEKNTKRFLSRFLVFRILACWLIV